MNTALWIITGLLASVFLAVGLMKLIQPKAKLVAAGQDWAADVPSGIVKVIGALEIAGAIGLILPAALDTATIVVPLAALGLALVMLCAAIIHGRRGEFPNVAGNVLLGGLAAFVAVQRFGQYAL